MEVELDGAEPLVAVRMLEADEADVAITYGYSGTIPRHWLGHDLRPVLTEDLVVISRPERRAPDV